MFLARTGKIDRADLSNSVIRRRVALAPAAWSPDGEHLAFLAIEEIRRQGNRMIVYTVRPNGSELTQVAEDAVSVPAWSPDGQRLAVAKYAGEAGEEVALFTLAADGSDERLITTITD